MPVSTLLRPVHQYRRTLIIAGLGMLLTGKPPFTSTFNTRSPCNTVPTRSSLSMLTLIPVCDESQSAFTRRLFKTVFPNGLDNDSPASRAPSRKPSSISLSVPVSEVTSQVPSPTPSGASTPKSGFFSRWGSSKLSVPSAPPSPTPSVQSFEDGPIEDLIMSGVAFGKHLPLLHLEKERLLISSRRVWTLQPDILPLACEGEKRCWLLWFPA
jgi:hypothetical protein